MTRLFEEVDRLDWLEAAQANVERHLGDCFDGAEDPTPEAELEEVYTLAYDGAHDAGADPATARQIAQKVAQSFAQS